MTPPTCEEISEEELTRVYLEDDFSWRHGAYRTEVYFRGSDKTYWEVNYAVSTDGESNGLREGSAIPVQVEPYPVQVEPYQKIVIAYRRKENE